jgi:hypothetical protein
MLGFLSVVAGLVEGLFACAKTLVAETAMMAAISGVVAPIRTFDFIVWVVVGLGCVGFVRLLSWSVEKTSSMKTAVQSRSPYSSIAHGGLMHLRRF